MAYRRRRSFRSRIRRTVRGFRRRGMRSRFRRRSSTRTTPRKIGYRL